MLCCVDFSLGGAMKRFKTSCYAGLLGDLKLPSRLICNYFVTFWKYADILYNRLIRFPNNSGETTTVLNVKTDFGLKGAGILNISSRYLSLHSAKLEIKNILTKLFRSGTSQDAGDKSSCLLYGHTVSRINLCCCCSHVLSLDLT
ncbi:hypothetical protein CEXT_622261 [Caerostris extrusa]|uniref:LAGLIDADG homing endonuclease n=1 Tax=Caerostris extrusa TaxID=172846 RepID=A0AAV4YBC4_CAEEX|nr:hypothetical protein CEXT_622261 [Caerostris extrusa]